VQRVGHVLNRGENSKEVVHILKKDASSKSMMNVLRQKLLAPYQ